MLDANRSGDVIREAPRSERPRRDDDRPLLRNPVDHFINHFNEWMRLDPARDFGAKLVAVDGKRPAGRHAVKLPYFHHQ